MIEVDKVDLVVSSYSTALIAPAMPVIMAHGMAFVSLLGSATNDAFHYDRTVNISPTGGHMQQDFAKGYFEMAMNADPKPKTVAIAGLDSDFLQRSMKSARNRQSDLGLEIVYDKSYPPGTVDYGPIVRAIQADKAGHCLFRVLPPDSVGLAQSDNEAKLIATVVGGGMIGPQITAIKAQFGPMLNNLLCWDCLRSRADDEVPGRRRLSRTLSRRRRKGENGSARTLCAAARLRADASDGAGGRPRRQDRPAAIGADFHANTFSTVLGDLKFDAKGEWEQERNLYVQYQGVKGQRHRAVQKARRRGHSLSGPIQVRETPDAIPGGGLRRATLLAGRRALGSPPAAMMSMSRPKPRLRCSVREPAGGAQLPRRTVRPMTLDPVLLLNALASGLLLGAFYALAASGLSVAFGLLDVVNIAHPAIMVAAAFAVSAFPRRRGSIRR